MPWRLIVVIVVFAVFLAFITFNLDNRCDISIGFTVFNDVPVFLTVFISFALGLFCTLPLAMNIGKRRKGKAVQDDKKEKKPEKDSLGGGNRGNYNGGSHVVN